MTTVKTKVEETPGGKLRAVQDTFNYQPRGEVINISPVLQQKYKEKYNIDVIPGSVIRINHHMIRPELQLWENVVQVGTQYQGHMVVTEGMIVGVESATAPFTDLSHLIDATPVTNITPKPSLILNPKIEL